MENDLKTEGSEAPFGLPNALIEVLREWEADKTCGWVFPNSDKRPWKSGAPGYRAFDQLKDLALRAPDRLSGGQKQLVAIASILAMRPGHMILDEPVAELDPEGRRLVGEALRSLAAAGIGLLIAEHDLDLLASLGARLVTIDGGRITARTPAAPAGAGAAP